MSDAIETDLDGALEIFRAFTHTDMDPDMTKKSQHDDDGLSLETLLSAAQVMTHCVIRGCETSRRRNDPGVAEACLLIDDALSGLMAAEDVLKRAGTPG